MFEGLRICPWAVLPTTIVHRIWTKTFLMSNHRIIFIWITTLVPLTMSIMLKCVLLFFFFSFRKYQLFTLLQSNANYVEIDQIYPLKTQEINYPQNHSPIYQNASDNTNRDTTPIYSNTNSDRFRNHAQGMTYGETLAHHLRHNWDHTDNTQGGFQFFFFML